MSGTLQIIIPPHCDPSMPLLGACQLCGYARSLGFESEVIDLSLELKAGDVNGLTGVDFESHHKYWTTIRTLNEHFASRYTETAPYASPTWDSAIIEAYKWNRFSDQVRFLSDCQKCFSLYDFYIKQIESRHEADFYFVSMMFASQFLDGLLLCCAIRQVAPRSKIVVGGGLITSLFKRQDDVRGPLAGLVDIISTGEGEFLIRFLAKSDTDQLLKNRSSDRHPTDALLLDASMFRDDLKVYVPMPFFDSLGKYLTHQVVLPYRVCASCYWNKCAFCTDWLYRSALHNVSIEEHAQRICGLEKVSTGVMFQDSALSPKVLQRLATELMRGKCRLRWGINARFDSQLTYEVLALARSSGCVFLRFGLESASRRVLSSMRKGIDVDVARRIIVDARKLGILTHVYCIVGYPGETDEDRVETRRFLMDEIAYPDSFNVSLYIPYFAARSNFNGSICHVSNEGWDLYPPNDGDESVKAFIDDLEADFENAHPIFRTLISPAHTIGSYDLVMRWV